MDSIEFVECINQWHEIWLGCPLLVHRRCIEPMFGISNAISYDNKMFKKTMSLQTDNILHIKKSVWIDIKGREEGEKDHFVLEQGLKVAQIIIKAINRENKFPEIYIISPFKTVIKNMKKLLKTEIRKTFTKYKREEINDWVDDNCGTIHTFQGREANEVIILLGYDIENSQSAAHWAGRTPNILNVAITRAKYRVVIIGDIELWKNVSYFDTAYEKLSSIENIYARS